MFALPAACRSVNPCLLRFRLRLRLRIEIRVEVRFRHLRLHASRRYLRFSDPDERIENRLAKIVVPPVVVKMAAGEAEAAAAVGPLDGPHHAFGPPLIRLN